MLYNSSLLFSLSLFLFRFIEKLTEFGGVDKKEVEYAFSQIVRSKILQLNP